jgi:predicted ATPase/DNA-binding SARP family transcriptional activator
MSAYRIAVLGTPLLTNHHQQPLHLERRKSLALLVYLAASGQAYTREALAAFLWGDSDDARAAAYLRNTLWTINRVLGDGWAILEGNTVQFNADSDIEVDIRQFRALIATQSASAVSDSAVRRARTVALDQAVALYRGDFMAGFTLPDAPAFADWQMVINEETRRLGSHALALLVEDYMALHQPEKALETARRWLLLDDLNENAVRSIMRLYAEDRQHNLALKTYQDFSQRLRRELRVQPEAETVALYEAIQDRRLQPALAPAVESTLPVPVAPALTTGEILALVPKKVLPAPATPFIGRDDELAGIAHRLQDINCRLITLLGYGGIGKTRLAIQAGEQAYASSNFPDGVYFVSLAPLCDVYAIAPTLTAALPFMPDKPQFADELLLEALPGKRLLLIMDNFEHLLEGADLLARILEAAPGVKMVVTSRERLNLHEEWVYELQGLAYPAADAAADIELYSAITLFVNSAKRLRPDFRLQPDDIPHISTICRLVEGMPLAIELAAGWLPVLTCEEIAQEIQTGLDFLTTSVRNVPERHRSLRAVFESAWQRLVPAEQDCLAQLSVFRGGFAYDAAAVVARANRHQLLSLVNKSLLRRSDTGQFEIHELLRQYAGEKLHALPDTQVRAVEQRHSAFYADLLVAQLPRLKNAEQVAALGAISAELDNIRTMLRHLIYQRDFARLLSILEPLFHFYAVRTSFNDLVEAQEFAINQLNPQSENAEERLLLGCLLAYVARWRVTMCHQSLIEDLVERSRVLLEQFGGQPAAALPTVLLGVLKKRPGRTNPDAEKLIRAGMAQLEQQGDVWGVAYALMELGGALHMQIRYAEAREIYNRSHELFLKIGQPWGIASILELLANNLFTLGNYPAAKDCYRQMLPLLEQLGMYHYSDGIQATMAWHDKLTTEDDRHEAVQQSIVQYAAIGDRRSVAWVRYNLGWLMLHQGHPSEATQLYQESLREFEDLGEEEGIIWSHIFLAACAVIRRDFADVETHAQHVRRLLAEMTFPWGDCGLKYVLGDAALAQNQLDTAETLYREAVKIAFDAESIMQTLRHLGGLADIFYRRGDDKTLALLLFIQHHPTTWDDTHKRIQPLLAQLTEPISAETLAAAQARANQWTLETCVAELLGA